MELPIYNDVLKAADRIAPYVYQTPVLENEWVNQSVGGRVLFKCENLQRVGAFKMRGATNFCLKNEALVRTKGVATHSSGNHARALACIARLMGIPAHIVMPENAPTSKIEGVRAEGARIVFCESNLAAREATLQKVVDETGAVFVPPYDHPDIMAGQGTAVLEALNQCVGVDIVIAPVGGGGLLSGSAIAAKGINPGIRVYGAEPEGADDAHRSLVAGVRITTQTPNTIADGLRTTLGVQPFEVVKTNVDDILLANDAEILAAMRLIIKELKIVIETSCATPLAVMLRNPMLFEAKTTLVVLSGGNTDWVKVQE